MLLPSKTRTKRTRAKDPPNQVRQTTTTRVRSNELRRKSKIIQRSQKLGCPSAKSRRLSRKTQTWQRPFFGRLLKVNELPYLIDPYCYAMAVLICSIFYSKSSPLVSSPRPRNSQGPLAIDQCSLRLAILRPLRNNSSPTRIFDTNADQHDIIPFAPFVGQARCIPFTILRCSMLFGCHSGSLANPLRRDPVHLRGKNQE